MEPLNRSSEANWRHYGIKHATLERYHRLLAEQGGVCKICQKAPYDGVALVWDQQPKTGMARWLLCDLCAHIVRKIERVCPSMEELAKVTAYLAGGVAPLEASDLRYAKGLRLDRPNVARRRELAVKRYNEVAGGVGMGWNIEQQLRVVAEEFGVSTKTIRNYINRVTAEV